MSRQRAGRLGVVLGFALMGLVLTPSASGAAPLDTVTVTGSGSSAAFITINAQSGPSGQNASGTATFTVPVARLGGPVTCLSVTGPDRGGGTAGSPTTAVLNFNDELRGLGNIAVRLVDNGGNGADILNVAPIDRAPTDCSPFNVGSVDTLTNGRAIVFDAPVLPTSKDQCKHGGWRNFPQFKNQGQCVAFVNHQARQACLAERATIGRPAFRAKYGKGPQHRSALRRCIRRTAPGVSHSAPPLRAGYWAGDVARDRGVRKARVRVG